MRNRRDPPRGRSVYRELNLSPSTYFARYKRPKSACQFRDGQLMPVIDGDALSGDGNEPGARGPVDHSTGPLNCCALGRIRSCDLLSPCQVIVNGRVNECFAPALSVTVSQAVYVPGAA